MELSTPGLVNASLVFTAAGDTVTVAVALCPYRAIDVIVSRPPMPLSFGLPPTQWPLASHVLKLYFLIVKFAVLLVMV